MAGLNPGFRATDFRGAVRFLAQMAAPTVVQDQAVFLFTEEVVYDSPVDAEDVPFDPAARPVLASGGQPAPRTSATVPCLVEYHDALNEPVPFGQVAPTRLAVTLLDEDYAQVKEARTIRVGGERYDYQHTEVPKGLFDVTLWRMWFVAEGEL